MLYKNMKELIETIKIDNEIKSVKFIESFHETFFVSLYLNKATVGCYKVYYEIIDNILYIQGSIVYDNVVEIYKYLSNEDQLIYKDLYNRASSKLTFNIMENNEIIDTIEYRANRTLEIMKSGHALYNYEGNYYYLFNSVEDAEDYIENGNKEMPYAEQPSIYEDGVEIDNDIWKVNNGFFIENEKYNLKKIRLSSEIDNYPYWEEIYISKNIPENIILESIDLLVAKKDSIKEFISLIRNKGFHADIAREEIIEYKF